MSLRDYLAKNEPKYTYRIKTVVPLDDDAMARIERTLAKYNPLDIGAVQKTILQRHPLDFAGVTNAEVYYIDIALGLPASSYILQQDIRMFLNIPEKFIVVRAPNEPTEVETQRINALADISTDAQKRGLTPTGLLSTDPAYIEVPEVPASDFYGDEYNSRFVQYLKQVADSREDPVVTPESGLFDWLKAPKEQEPTAPKEDFNAGYRKTSSPVKGEPTSNSGNLDNNEVTYTRVFKNDKGKKTVLSQTGVAVKKGR